MKIFDKLKRTILIFALVVGIGLTSYGISKTAKAAVNTKYPVVTFTYAMYEKDSFDAYYFTYTGADGVKYGRNSIKKAIDAANTAPSMEQMAWNFGIFGSNGIYSSAGLTYDVAKGLLDASPSSIVEVTTLTPGKDVVVAAYASTSDGSDIFATQVALDIRDMIDGTAYYYNKPGYENDTNVIHSSKDPVSLKDGVILGMSYDSSSSGVFSSSDVLVGAVAFKLSSNVSSSSVIKFNNRAIQGQTLFGSTTVNGGNGSINMGSLSCPDNFAEEQLAFTSQAQSNNTELDTLTVDGNNALNGTVLNQ